MEIKLSTDSLNVIRTGDGAAKPLRPATADGSPSFQQSQALDASLNQLPDVRPAAVERGKALVSLAQYPPIEMMHKIARLLAFSADDLR